MLKTLIPSHSEWACTQYKVGNCVSHFCFRKSSKSVLSDNYVTSFLIQEHMFSRFSSICVQVSGSTPQDFFNMS